MKATKHHEWAAWFAVGTLVLVVTALGVWSQVFQQLQVWQATVETELQPGETNSSTELRHTGITADLQHATDISAELWRVEKDLTAELWRVKTDTTGELRRIESYSKVAIAVLQVSLSQVKQEIDALRKRADSAKM
eukprot:TRINITY_DN822_c0_g1_i5.p2 TRINITY_DN822_c0_g1~~TRINITY_DN822_c0_g1_i5.p2  ORF type:complete len:136 (+),score=35.89 TRINITY_DN822_c0_g1_i5:917-1324(+)